MASSNLSPFAAARARALRPYLDSSVFFAHLKKELHVADNGRARWEIAYNLLRAAREGRFKIFTSTLTIAEVRRIKEKSVLLDASELTLAQSLFRHSYIEPIEPSRDITEKAQELGAKYGIEVIDAVHLATAILNKPLACDFLFVWDKRFTSAVPSTVENVVICEPYWDGIYHQPS